MNKPPIRLGPLALLLTVISICMTVFAILTFSTARADLALAKRYAYTTSVRYNLEKSGQEYLQEVDEILKDGGTLYDLFEAEMDSKGISVYQIEESGYTLTIGLKQKGSTYSIEVWKIEKEWNQDEKIEDLWIPG